MKTACSHKLVSCFLSVVLVFCFVQAGSICCGDGFPNDEIVEQPSSGSPDKKSQDAGSPFSGIYEEMQKAQQPDAQDSGKEVFDNGSPFAGMYEELLKTKAEQKQVLATDSQLTDVPKSGDYDAEGNYLSAELEKNELLQVSRIEELKALITQVESKETSREKEMQLRRLRVMLRAASEINGQIENIRPKLGSDKKRVEPSPSDVFVIAKILVEPKSTTADVTFSLLAGELANANDLFDYLAGTPAGNFRDYRIISRHGTQENAETAIAQVRLEYDAYKEREAQMLAYIAARNAALAKVKSCRRCCGCGK